MTESPVEVTIVNDLTCRFISDNIFFLSLLTRLHIYHVKNTKVMNVQKTQRFGGHFVTSMVPLV